MICSISGLDSEILPNLERHNVKSGLKMALTWKYVVKHVLEGVFSGNLFKLKTLT